MSAKGSPGRVAFDDIASVAAFQAQLEALTCDDCLSRVYLAPTIEICHADGWLIATAVFEDDTWWLDFTNYGIER